MSICKKCQIYEEKCQIYEAEIKIYEEKCQIHKDHHHYLSELFLKVDNMQENFWIDRHHTLWNVAQDIIDKLTLEIDQLKIKLKNVTKKPLIPTH